MLYRIFVKCILVLMVFCINKLNWSVFYFDDIIKKSLKNVILDVLMYKFIKKELIEFIFIMGKDGF